MLKVSLFKIFKHMALGKGITRAVKYLQSKHLLPTGLLLGFFSGLKKQAAKVLAYFVVQNVYKWANKPAQTQAKVFKKLIKEAKHTRFGKEHHFDAINSYASFAQNVPLRDYEDFTPYIEAVKQGKRDVLWKGLPLYFAKTSGTTSGTKYIPITKESMPHHIAGARNAILHYIYQTGKVEFVSGKMIFLQGSPILSELNGIKVGRLSGISAHYVPAYLQSNRLPSWETNCIENWEEKVEQIVTETINEPMTLISGIPPWVQMYFERLKARSGQSIGELFKGFSLFIYGGVSYEPYRSSFERLIGRSVDSIELYPASEGFFAYQDTQESKGLLLLLNSGMFYEFVKVEDMQNSSNPYRYTIGEVELGVNYVLVVSSNAGLWGYNTGDTIKFISLTPHRIVVTGRLKHFISAFGEHVIGKEVEEALRIAIAQYPEVAVNEFSVAPQVSPPEGGLPYHQWFIEFSTPPNYMQGFAQSLDAALQAQNTYYNDLITGKVLRPLRITSVPAGGFARYMKEKGKLGGQNKLPRLANNREIATALEGIISQMKS